MDKLGGKYYLCCHIIQSRKVSKNNTLNEKFLRMIHCPKSEIMWNICQARKHLGYQFITNFPFCFISDFVFFTHSQPCIYYESGKQQKKVKRLLCPFWFLSYDHSSICTFSSNCIGFLAIPKTREVQQTPRPLH